MPAVYFHVMQRTKHLMLGEGTEQTLIQFVAVSSMVDLFIAVVMQLETLVILILMYPLDLDSCVTILYSYYRSSPLTWCSC